MVWGATWASTRELSAFASVARSVGRLDGLA
jgi:hypothetical protein